VHACEAKVDYESQIGSSDHHDKRERERDIEIANKMSIQVRKKSYLSKKKEIDKYI